MNRLDRLVYAMRHHFTRETLWKRSVDAQQYLLDVANNKRPMPTGEQLRQLALYLGAPDDKKPEFMK